MDEKCEKSLKIVDSALERCIKMQPKFPEGTAQCSLLRNRIRALQLVRSLLVGSGQAFSPEELGQALAPIRSIRSKTANARGKYAPGSPQYRRFTPTVEAMDHCLSLLDWAISRRDT
ncbi:MAG: hypothetical protein Q4F17_07490 [Eubacteriales bacterium]|nr:hypothetical protein [Eubacteriales bacterium]